MKRNRDLIARIATARGLANAFLREELAGAGLPDLAPTHGNIIFTLLRDGVTTMTDLAAAIRRDKSTVTALVKKLEALGYVERRPSALDSRTVEVALTDRGRALRQPFLDISDRLSAIAFRGVPQEESRRFGETLDKIIENFSRRG